MLTFARWLSETPLSSALRARDGLVPLLQTLHILAVAMILSSMLMIDHGLFGGTRDITPADTVRRFEAWIWSGLGLLALTGATLIVIEPERTLPNGSFQIKLVLLTLAAAVTLALCRSLRRKRKAAMPRVGRWPRTLALAAFGLWCAVAAAGRFIAYTQPG